MSPKWGMVYQYVEYSSKYKRVGRKEGTLVGSATMCVGNFGCRQTQCKKSVAGKLQSCFTNSA